MKFSFIATVRNEEAAILNLLKSLETQSQLPDEVIIVDGGSTDSTVKILETYQRKSSLNLRILEEKSNRSRGRNLGIGEATGEGIVVSDAGCVLDKNWLRQITGPIKSKKADAVAGFYKMKTDTFFTRCSAPFVGLMSHNIKGKTFLPSSRSIAFSKKTWQQIGGYPIYLDYAEDLIFADNIFKHPELRLATVKSALVEWTPPQNITSFFKAIKNYTRGNIEAGYRPHLKKNYFVILRYLFGFGLFAVSPKIASALFIAYLFYPSLKFFRLIKTPLDIFCFTALQITADLAVISAFI